MLMEYSSNLTDAEWKIFEPLLQDILSAKKQTRPTSWTLTPLGFPSLRTVLAPMSRMMPD
jgi:hypothetical protein